MRVIAPFLATAVSGDLHLKVEIPKNLKAAENEATKDGNFARNKATHIIRDTHTVEAVKKTVHDKISSKVKHIIRDATKDLEEQKSLKKIENTVTLKIPNQLKNAQILKKSQREKAKDKVEDHLKASRDDIEDATNNVNKEVEKLGDATVTYENTDENALKIKNLHVKAELKDDHSYFSSFMKNFWNTRFENYEKLKHFVHKEGLFMANKDDRADVACTDDDEARFAKKPAEVFKKEMYECSKTCWGAHQCTADCLAKYDDWNLSAPCNLCFGNMAECTRNHCFLPCINGNSPGCTECSRANCIPDFRVCSGIPDLPQEPTPKQVQKSDEKCSAADITEWNDSTIKIFNDKMTFCGKKCWAQHDCVLQCLDDDKDWKLSHSCNECFADTSECTRNHCFLPCVNGNSPGCTECTRKNCLPDFITCSGIPDLPHAVNPRNEEEEAPSSEARVVVPMRGVVNMIKQSLLGGAKCEKAEINIWRNKASTEYKPLITNCGQQCWGKKDCVTQCVATFWKLSNTCSTCFGDHAECIQLNCMGKEGACEQCKKPFEKCTGFQMKEESAQEVQIWG